MPRSSEPSVRIAPHIVIDGIPLRDRVWLDVDGEAEHVAVL
jgi:hypothetical protein